MEYDGILKWDQREGCSPCYHAKKGNSCIDLSSCDMSNGYRQYINAVQLKGLIEEAEAGYPANAETGYGGYDGLWVCEAKNECTEKACSGQRPHKKNHACVKGCFKSDIDAVCIPFRGTKGEPQKFNGIDKDIRGHKAEYAAVDDLRTVENPTSGDFTDLKSFTVTVQGIKKNPTAADCSEVGSPGMDADEYFGKPLKVDFGKEDRSDIKAKWDDDGKGCTSCTQIKAELMCNYDNSCNCGVSFEYRMYERKEDRSDLEYNKKSEFLRDVEVDMEDDGGITIVINDDLTPISDIKVTAEVQEDDVEYVVKHEITCKELSLLSKIKSFMFLDIYRSFGLRKEVPGALIHCGHVLHRHAQFLVDMDFIERKVDDPWVNLGECYKHQEDGIFRATWCGDWLMTFTRVKKNGQYGTAGAHLPNGPMAGNPVNESFRCKLSDLVGKDRLSEFTSCTIEIREVD